jgi:hypothetical protein
MMGARSVSALGLAVAAVSLAGCGIDYIGATYTTPVGPTIVTVGCNTSYEVYENAKYRTALVRTNVGGELADAFCAEDRHLGPRTRRAVQIHLEKTQRPHCKVVEERKLTAIHWEYVYACESPRG